MVEGRGLFHFHSDDGPVVAVEVEAGDALGAIDYLHWLMDRDPKSGPLEALQGRVGEEGFARAEFRGRVYPDVPPALVRRNCLGRKVHIYSSGSVLAQRLLFRPARPVELRWADSRRGRRERGPVPAGKRLAASRASMR